jgi:glycerol-3-phosphate dehydrogenase
LETLDEVSREGLDAGFTPPDTSREAARGVATALTTVAPTQTEGTVVRVDGISLTDRLVSSDLVSIEAGGATIVSTNIVVTVQTLEDNTLGVRVRSTDTSLPPGLYVGHLRRPDGQTLAPVQLYLSRAIGT